MAATQYVAFLRAVNVGGRIVKMTELKKIFETTGMADVSTFIASGNVIFRANARSRERLQQQLERALQQSLGYTVTTMVRATGEVAAAAAAVPYTPDLLAQGALYVGFMRKAPEATAVAKTEALSTPVDTLIVRGTDLYWLARKNISESTITGAAIEKALRTPVTLRNINTVRRLAARYPSADPAE